MMANFLQLFIVLVAIFSALVYADDRCATKKKFFGCFYFKSFNKCLCTTRRACNDPFHFKSEQQCMKQIKILQGACKRHPCLNKGICEPIKSHSEYTCDCTGTTFYGKRCHKACPRPSQLSLDWLQGYAEQIHWKDTPLACIMNKT